MKYGCFDEIRYDIPVPKIDGRRTKRARMFDVPMGSRWDLIKLDGSVLVPTANDAQAAYKWGARHGVIFTREQNSKGYRIWRIA